MNKKRLSYLIAMTIGLMMVESSLSAGPTVEVTLKYSHFKYFGNFANFATPTGIEGLSDGERFQTFCIEAGERLRSGRTYDAIVNYKAVSGVEGDDGDPLDSKTAFLYDSFLDGKLKKYGFVYGDGHRAMKSNAALQRVIWYIEDEQGKYWRKNSLEERLYQASLNCDWTDTRNIRVINLYEDGQMRQDQIVRISENGEIPVPAVVPAPGAMLLGGIGVVLVGWLRTRKAL